MKPTQHGFSYQSPFGAALDVRFLQPETLPLESKEASRTMVLYNQGGINWRNAGSPVEGNNVTETLTVTSAGPTAAGTDILAALTPLGAGERAPAFERLADGVVRVTTTEGVDTAFLAASLIRYTQGEIAFEGLAGAVRVRGNQVTLIVSEGPAKVTYRNLTLESAVPAERTFASAAKESVTLPAPARTGVYEVQDHGDRITGKMHGVNGGFHLLKAPAWLDRLAELRIDGQTYAPGTAGDTFIIPVMPGEHTFELRPLEQPPIWRNRNAW